MKKDAVLLTQNTLPNLRSNFDQEKTLNLLSEQLLEYKENVLKKSNASKKKRPNIYVISSINQKDIRG